jgi:hypothetical protein
MAENFLYALIYSRDSRYSHAILNRLLLTSSLFFQCFRKIHIFMYDFTWLNVHDAIHFMQVILHLYIFFVFLLTSLL